MKIGMAGSLVATGLLNLLRPGPHLDLPAPGAAVLSEQMHVARRDGVGVEQAVGPVRRYRPAFAADAAVDDHVADVNAGRRQLARDALREAAQRELAHRKRRRLSIALHAR